MSQAAEAFERQSWTSEAAILKSLSKPEKVFGKDLKEPDKA